MHTVIASSKIEESPKWHLLSMVLDEIHKECLANIRKFKKLKKKFMSLNINFDS